MKVVDGKGRLFGLINVIDLAVLLVAVGALAFVAFSFLGSSTITITGGGMRDIEFTVRCRSVPEEIVGAIKEGDQLVSVTNYVNAYIKSFSAAPGLTQVSDSDGNVMLSEVPGRVELFITVRATVNESVPVIKLGSQELAVAKVFTFKTHFAEAQGYIQDITVLG
ncbi:MAG: DUF4330 domain-containing protein [Oscillospiraceae bacterium]|nr:DUF4330 domain-containing protein [Oscillospiraceae bacterium]